MPAVVIAKRPAAKAVGTDTPAAKAGYTEINGRRLRIVQAVDTNKPVAKAATAGAVAKVPPLSAFEEKMMAARFQFLSLSNSRLRILAYPRFKLT